MTFKKTILPNGVRVITAPMPGNPTVTVMLNVATGSFYEIAEQSGISHFLEHVCFKGTVKRPTPRIITTELDSIGAAYNAFTSYEVTGYWTKADVKHFDKIADITADIFKNSVFPEAEIEKEKGVIIGEIDMYGDDPQEKIFKTLNEHMYAGETASRDVGGTKETVRSIDRAALLAYRQSQYVGPNVVVTIAGSIEESAMLDWAKANLSDLASKQGSPELLTTDKKQVVPETVFIDKDTDQAHLVMAWRTFPKSHPDRYVAGMIRSILGSGMSSRLFIRLREEMGSGYYLSAMNSLQTSFGRFIITTGTTHERVPEIMAAIIKEVDRFKTEPVLAVELEKVKEYRRAHRLMGLETSDDVAAYFGSQEIDEKEILMPEEFDAIYAKITAEDIMRVARIMFDRTKLTVAVIGKGIDKEAVTKAIS